jgi:hypothetical protein
VPAPGPRPDVDAVGSGRQPRPRAQVTDGQREEQERRGAHQHPPGWVEDDEGETEAERDRYEGRRLSGAG